MLAAPNRLCRSHRQLVRSAIALLLLQVVESSTKLGKERCEARGERSGVGILEIDIDTIEAVVLNHADCATDKSRALRRIGDEVEVSSLRVRPATNRQENLEVSRLLSVT